MAKILTKGFEISRKYIAKNSEVVTTNNLVSLSGWFLIKAIATWEIYGVAERTLTAASDNQTVAKKTIPVAMKNPSMIVELTASAASLTNADVGSYFNLVVSTQLVDYATKATSKQYVNTSDAWAAVDVVIDRQLELIEVISTTVGKFAII